MLLIFKLFCPIKLLLALDKLQLIENNLSTEADVGGKASIHRNYPILKNRTKTQLFFQVPCLKPYHKITKRFKISMIQSSPGYPPASYPPTFAQIFCLVENQV